MTLSFRILNTETGFSITTVGRTDSGDFAYIDHPYGQIDPVDFFWDILFNDYYYIESTNPYIRHVALAVERTKWLIANGIPFTVGVEAGCTDQHQIYYFWTNFNIRVTDPEQALMLKLIWEPL